ncbi:MAG: TIGR04282 family arsenosugar biosynthesis glycosyltransferase [Acidobacteriales bacterium]|nr:TIGR04282 family arsenosugar biosynthesis glycosyltransferase [Terriglobales bacterium]
MHEATICIFAKPPRPGEVKTRLAPAIGAVNAARVAAALLEDAIHAALHVPGAQVIISATERFALPHRSLPIWPQPEGDLGVRIEHTMRKALLESKCAIAVGADTPGLTTAILATAVQYLRSIDAVLGPAEDGGYYLIGLRRCPRNLLRDIRWSHSATLEDTRARFRRFGITSTLLPKRFDLDTPDDLARLRSLLAVRDIVAPHLHAVLNTIPALSRETVA